MISSGRVSSPRNEAGLKILIIVVDIGAVEREYNRDIWNKQTFMTGLNRRGNRVAAQDAEGRLRKH